MIRRTAAITAASIAGVIIAGGAAVGANVGILNAANDPTFGTLSADAAIFNAEDTSTSTSTSSTLLNRSGNQASQVFSVDTAGTVTVETDGTGLRVADVVANAGWTWEAGHGSGAVIVRFTSGTDTLDFRANVNSDGSIEASVRRPAVRSTTTAVTTSPTGSYDDDDHDDDHDEDHDEDHDKEHDEDHDEYEGRDDDD